MGCVNGKGEERRRVGSEKGRMRSEVEDYY